MKKRKEAGKKLSLKKVQLAKVFGGRNHMLEDNLQPCTNQENTSKPNTMHDTGETG